MKHSVTETVLVTLPLESQRQSPSLLETTTSVSQGMCGQGTYEVKIP